MPASNVSRTRHRGLNGNEGFGLRHARRDVRVVAAGSDIGPLLAAVFEASDEDDASDNGGGLRQGDAAEAPSRAGTPPLGGGPHRRAPSLWDALSKPDTELRTQQLPFDCCDRSVDINQVRYTLYPVRYTIYPMRQPGGIYPMPYAAPPRR